jgi:uncharacterized ferritin-like protein (DUF455 family)/nitrite reductase/ring-hydroxylating ferredoxin subunit
MAKVWKELTIQDTDTRLEIEIDDKKYTIIKVGSEYYGIESVCPHSGGPLGLGDIEDASIKCPWHGFIFSLRDGSCEDDPCHGAETLILKVELGKLWVQVDSNQEIKTVQVTNLNLQELNDDVIQDPITLIDWARCILGTSDAREKVLKTQKVLELWEKGEISEIGKSVNLITVPKRDKVTEYRKVGKRGNAGTLESRIAIIHALANIEQWAIDLGWDIIVRFGEFMPKEFSQEFMKLAADEARHFTLLENRLKELGSYFGALMVHGSLWDSALETRDDVLARLAIVHMVHEGRGLDVNPKTIDKFKKVGDLLTVEKLEIIHAVIF